MSVIRRDDVIREVARQLAEEFSELDEATAWNLLYPPNGMLAPLAAYYEGAVGVLRQARDEFRAALADDESAEWLRDLIRDFIAAADGELGGSKAMGKADGNGVADAR